MQGCVLRSYWLSPALMCQKIVLLCYDCCICLPACNMLTSMILVRARWFKPFQLCTSDSARCTTFLVTAAVDGVVSSGMRLNVNPLCTRHTAANRRTLLHVVVQQDSQVSHQC